jgi:hypothetical protein
LIRRPLGLSHRPSPPPATRGAGDRGQPIGNWRHSPTPATSQRYLLVVIAGDGVTGSRREIGPKPLSERGDAGRLTDSRDSH